MPRSSSRSGSSRGSGGMFSSPAKPAAPRSHAPPPATYHAPPPAHPPTAPSGGIASGIGSTIVQGMAFGTGSAIAHRAVGAVSGALFGGSDEPKVEATTAPAQPPAPRPVMDCSIYQRDFAKCLQENKSDISACQFYMDNFNTCQAEAKMA